jgi:hypothetical protein
MPDSQLCSHSNNKQSVCIHSRKTGRREERGRREGGEREERGKRRAYQSVQLDSLVGGSSVLVLRGIGSDPEVKIVEKLLEVKQTTESKKRTSFRV